MEYCRGLLPSPVWIVSLTRCIVHEMVRDDPHNPDDPKETNETRHILKKANETLHIVKKTNENLQILMNKPNGAVAKPTMAELNRLINETTAVPFSSAEEAYYYVFEATKFVSLDGARQGAGCPGYE